MKTMPAGRLAFTEGDRAESTAEGKKPSKNILVVARPTLKLCRSLREGCLHFGENSDVEAAHRLRAISAGRSATSIDAQGEGACHGEETAGKGGWRREISAFQLCL